MSSTHNPLSSFEQSPLWRVLTRAIPDTLQNRAMQEMLDRHLDARLPEWDVTRGLHGAMGVTLPHETEPGYWSLPVAQRKALCSIEAQKIYAANHGRTGTSHLFVAAFCFHSPLSRHHRKPELAQIVLNALHYFANSVTSDGCLGAALTPAEPWSEGWDVEGLIYSSVWLRDLMTAPLFEQLHAAFSRCAARLATLTDKPSVIGSYGNQRLVYALGLELYGQFLGDASLRQKARAVLEDALPKVLDESGQVIEQMGPCMHYSYTAFFYAWLNLVVKDEVTPAAAHVLRAVRWFVDRHTRDLTPFAGPSTRKYYEIVPSVVIDLLPAAVQFTRVDEELVSWVVRAVGRAVELESSLKPDEITQFRAGVTGHGGSPVVWAMLMSAAESQVSRDAVRESGRSHGVSLYDSCTLLKRSPLRYLLVHRQYQTHYNFTDFLPFSGIQTWAWSDEPPLLHPTPMHPSTTRAMGIDTARQGASHNWGLFGAGAVGIDGYTVLPRERDDPAWLVARYDQLFRLVIFTAAATVQIEFGGSVGGRTTRWTLNRLCPAEPVISTGVVRFTGRKACLHSSLAQLPMLHCDSSNDPWARDVRWLEYDCGSDPALFALSDERFELLAPVRVDEDVRFRDASGSYTIRWDERFTRENPGCLRVDTFALAHGTRVIRQA